MPPAVPIKFRVNQSARAMLSDATQLAAQTIRAIDNVHSVYSTNSNLVKSQQVESVLMMPSAFDVSDEMKAKLAFQELGYTYERGDPNKRLEAALIAFYSEYLWRIHGDHHVKCFLLNEKRDDSGRISFEQQTQALVAMTKSPYPETEMKFYVQERANVDMKMQIKPFKGKFTLLLNITVRDVEKRKQEKDEIMPLAYTEDEEELLDGPA